MIGQTPPKAIRAVCILITITMPAVAFAEQATPSEMESVCRNWLAYEVYRGGSWAGEQQPQIAEVQPLIATDGTLLAYCYSISPRGYILVPVLRELPAVIACSQQSSLDVSQTQGPAQMLRELLSHRVGLFVQTFGTLDAAQLPGGVILFDEMNRESWDLLAVAAEEFQPALQPGTFRTDTVAGPLLVTAWIQGAPYNNLCPVGDGGRCLVGCVATATAQIMRYHRWPPFGVGSHEYTWGGDYSCDPNHPVGGGPLSATFSDPYDWAKMPYTCSGGCTAEQEAALAELCYEVGVAYDMNYGACGSGASTAEGVTVLPTHFRYDPSINKQDRADHTPTTWFQVIQTEINAHRPMLYRIFSHAIVCDGWRNTSGLNQIHMNYGWADSHTAWYSLDNLHCPWTGCDPNVEFLIRDIKPPLQCEVVAWGNNSYGQCNVPAPNSGFVAVADGGLHSLGLKANGSIAAWGLSNYGQGHVPAPNSGFVAVAGGAYHSLGLKADGSIVAWGNNSYGQCNVPAPNGGFVAVAGGGYHSLGLKADGSIVAWGAGQCGQSGFGHAGQSCVPTPNSGFVAVAGGDFHSLGLRADGSIVAWGENTLGECNVPMPNSGFIAVAGGGAYSLGLKADGSIVAWGSNYDADGNYVGQCNVPAPNSGFVAVAGGCWHSLGLKADGSIVAWGYDAYGQCNVPAPNSGFVAIAGGFSHSLAIKLQEGGEPPPGDLNRDGVVDSDDFVFFCNSLSGPDVAATAEADLDAEGDADMADFALFQAAFTGS